MSTWLAPVRLAGISCTLEPLAVAHHDELAAAAADGELWKLWYTAIPSPEAMRGEIARRLDLQAKGSMLPFTTRNAEGRVVGMTTYMNVDATHKRVEIGSTWTAASEQRGPFNTECKLLLLGHAFEQLGCIAVEFRTHFFNQQSRRAIERLGARLDGILRNHQRASNGTLRDTCVYSITEAEWPTVKTHLRWQLDKPR
ncbi:GNAT family protein [soil metagenome]